MPLRGGAGKALRAMQSRYGAQAGRRIFYATANKRGSGKSMDAKARNAFKKNR
jgi:hypothetical protein